jgi:hypothetical protein
MQMKVVGLGMKRMCMWKEGVGMLRESMVQAQRKKRGKRWKTGEGQGKERKKLS